MPRALVSWLHTETYVCDVTCDKPLYVMTCLYMRWTRVGVIKHGGSLNINLATLTFLVQRDGKSNYTKCIKHTSDNTYTHTGSRKAVFMCFGHKSNKSVRLFFPPMSLLTGIQIRSKEVKSAVTWNKK